MKKYFILLGLIISITNIINSQIQLIPKPQEVKLLDGSFILSDDLSITSIGVDKQLETYVKEYLSTLYKYDFNGKQNKNTSITLIVDEAFLKEKPEAYSLKISPNGIEIISSTEKGLFYGIQSLIQLLPKDVSANKEIKIPACEITDYPQFSWRGFNWDCSRHFQSKEFIKRYIDILAYYKFNTFHWHLTDDQGWRIEIIKYPKLTEIGAWRKEPGDSIYGGFYTQEDIKEIVAYAESRYINVVPEIEMPGHSIASLASYPENSCTGGPFEVTNIWGVHKDIYCAGRDSTFYFLQDIVDEVINLFPGKYIHIGGDEAPKDRWKECPRCQARIKAEGLKDEHELQSYFIKRISNYLQSKGKTVIGWDEILQGLSRLGGSGLAPGAIVQSWQSFQGAVDAAKLEHNTIVSPASHTYLNSSPEDVDLRIVYSFNPVPEELTSEQKQYVIGSEVNLWSEQAPEEKVDIQLFPRILALAEIFWTGNEKKNYDEFYGRVQFAYDDLDARGIKYGAESKAITPATTFDETSKQFIVNVTKGQKGIEVCYTEDGTTPNPDSKIYSEPIKINKTVSLNIAAFRDGNLIGKTYNLSFDFHKALNSKITLVNKYDERYRASGDNGLIDGVRASTNLRDGLWQGYEGVDFEAVIDLGEEKEISEVTPSFLLDSNSWIFLPEKVEISVSKNNADYSEIKTISNDTPQKNSEIIIKDFPANFKQSARYIKVKAESIKKCPEWHPGAGGKAWLFIDEIVVE